MEGREHGFIKSNMPAALVLFLTAGLAGCESKNSTAPSERALVTFQAGGEQFRVQLTGKDQVEAARRAQQGGAARIPNGRIILGASENAGWSWHLEDVAFVEVEQLEVVRGADAERRRDRRPDEPAVLDRRS